MFKLFAVLAFVPAIFAATPINPCPGGLPSPTAIYFNGRENPCLVEPCKLSRSIGVGITEVEFDVPFDSVSIMPRIRATVFGTITITQELPADIANNPCGILETPHSCPLSSGQHASYRLEMPIDPTTPLIPTDTEITLFGDNNQVIFCYKLKSEVVA